jgi:hypothetical protein
MKKCDEERIKYLATLVNTCAAASCFTIGILIPIGTALYGLQPAPSIAALIAGALSWLLATFALHLSARRILGALPDA